MPTDCSSAARWASPAISKMRGAKYSTALMPDSWLNKAIRNASRIGTRSRDPQNGPASLFSKEIARISSAWASIRAAGAPGSIRRSTSRPATRSRLRPSSHLGLSGSSRQRPV